MGWVYWSHTSKFYFTEKEINFTKEYFDYKQFLLQEFFSADEETKSKIQKYYTEIYGFRSFSYLSRKYLEWAKGDFHLTILMKDRILSFMPMFLNDKAKNKLGIHEFMVAIKKTIKSFESIQRTTFINSYILDDLNKIDYLYREQLNKIRTLILKGNFRFKVLTELEKKEILEICKYILRVKLQKKIEQVERDFNTFLPLMKCNKNKPFTANYHIDDFRYSIDITNFKIINYTFLKFNIEEIKINNKYKVILDKYLAYEFTSIYKDIKKRNSDSLLNTNDIQMFFNHFDELFNSDVQFDLKSTFQGQGGVLFLKANYKPIKVLKNLILNSLSKIFICIFGCYIICYGLIYIQLYKMFLFVGLVVGIYSLGSTINEIKIIILLIKEYKLHGKLQSIS
jgi:hypothetical protein